MKSRRTGLFLYVLIVATLFAVAVSGNVSAEGNPPDGMVSYWRFEEGSGTTTADSVGINQGTIFGGATWTTGQVEGALYFDGNDDYVEVTDSPNLNFGTGDLTLEAWFKTVHGRANIIIKRNQDYSKVYDLYITEGGHLIFSLADAPVYVEVTSTVTILDNVWHHAVGAREGDVAKLYIDGELNASLDASGLGDLDNSDNVFIGIDLVDEYEMQGIIDEVAVYNRALTLDEIQYHYQRGLSGKDYLPDSSDEATQDLITDVQSLNLSDGIENSFVSKLDNAIKSIENDRPSAEGQLRAFINEVEAQRGNELTNEQADTLISSAQEIIDKLSG